MNCLPAAISFSESCGDDICEAGEFTSKITCFKDCNVFEVTFYFNTQSISTFPTDIPGHLRSMELFGSETVIAPMMEDGRIIITVRTRVLSQAEAIQKAVEMGIIQIAVSAKVAQFC